MLAMCTIAGCSDNELNGSNEPGVYPGHPEDAVYMNVNIQLPVGGKTQEVKPTQTRMMTMEPVQTVRK